MADVNASIGVNIDASNALAEIKSLQRQISNFHSSIVKSSQTAAIAQQDLQRNFINSVNSIGAFSAELRTVKTTAENFTTSLEKNKFSMREYFRYAGASTKTFGRLFRSEFDTVNKVAVENVKRLQTQYIKMGRDASGAMKAIAIMPTELDMTNLSTKTQIAAQRQALFNQVVKQGSTNLLNFGKNTQWAGRQLMVGFTLPLVTLGTTASRVFMEMETQALKFKKVYGDLFTPAAERQQALADITALGQMFTKYGIAVSETVGLASEAAAAGFQGIDLQRQTTEATRLQVLGQIDAQKALETTISLQNAFQMQSADLADSINFLNAVENQTVVSLDDITTAIPKAAPVVRQLGGDVKDLAFFMAAMKEGGINASEGANALKSGLASLINPTNKAKEMMASFGIDIDAIVNKNAGNVKQTVIEFATALDQLSNLNRQRAIEQLFGKFQLARLSTLFENVTKSGNQASRVLDLATASTGDLAAMAEQELGMTADSAMNKFRKSVEDLKFALVPVGEVFISVVTPFVEKIGAVIEKFNGLSDTTKKVITLITVGIGGLAPIILMTIGLMGNFVANGMKGLMILRNGFLRLTGQSKILGEQTQYFTTEQQNALAAAHSLEQSHAVLIQTFTVEAQALNKLKKAYEATTIAQNNFAARNPMMMMPGAIKPTKRAKGKPAVVGGTGNKDSELALLMPGETVIPTKMSKKYAGLINGMVADNIPGYQDGLVPGYTNAVSFLSSAANQGLKGKKGVSSASIAAEFSQGGAGIQAPIVRAVAESLGATKPNEVVKLIANDPNLAKFGTNISMGVAEELSKISGNVTDPQLSKIYQDVARKQAKNFGQVYQDATEKFLTDITTFEDVTQQRISGPESKTPGRGRSIGRTGLFTGKRSYRSMGFGKIAAALGTPSLKGKVMAHMTGRQMIDLNEMSQQGTLTTAAQNAVARMSGQATTVAAKTVKKSQKSKSPSKVAQQLGLDFGDGYAEGIKKATPEVAAASAGLTTGATTAIKKTGIRGRVSGMARGLAGGRFGLAASSALMAGSMLPGKVGDIAGQASGVAFGLQAVGMALKVLPGPLKLVAVAAGAAALMIKLNNDARKKEEERINGLGNAAYISGKKLTTLGAMFDFVPRTPLFESLPKGNAGISTVGITQQARVDQIRASEDFLKTYKSELEAIRNATAQELPMVLKSMAQTLQASGAGKDAIEAIITAFQQETGKTGIKLDLGLVDITSEDYNKNLQKDLDSVISMYDKTYDKHLPSIIAAGIGKAMGFTSKIPEAYEKNLKMTASIVTSYTNNIGLALKSGQISAAKFNESFNTLIGSVNKLGNESQKLALMKKIFETMGSDAMKAADGIKNAADATLLFNAVALGAVGPDSPVVSALKNSSDLVAQGRARTDIRNITKDAIAAAEVIGKAFQDSLGGTTPTGTTTSTEKVLSAQAKLTIARLKKELDALKTKRDTLREINDEIKRQYDYEQKQKQLQSEAAQAKISGNYIQAAILGQQQLFARAEFSRETQSMALDKKITALENRISALSAGARVSAAEKAVGEAKTKAKKGYATGGLIVGAGSSMSDSIGAYAGGKMISLSNGEYVMRAKAVNQYGVSTMNAINSGKVSTTEVGGTVYNINMTVNGGSANSQEVAKLVIRELQNKVNKNNKSNKVHI